MSVTILAILTHTLGGLSTLVLTKWPLVPIRRSRGKLAVFELEWDQWNREWVLFFVASKNLYLMSALQILFFPYYSDNKSPSDQILNTLHHSKLHSLWKFREQIWLSFVSSDLHRKSFDSYTSCSLGRSLKSTCPLTRRQQTHTFLYVALYKYLGAAS